jgi:hypothetical protein
LCGDEYKAKVMKPVLDVAWTTKATDWFRFSIAGDGILVCYVVIVTGIHYHRHQFGKNITMRKDTDTFE